MNKQSFFAIVITVLLSMVGTQAMAYDYDIAVENADGVTIFYSFINDGKELAVTSQYDETSTYSGVINIPSHVTYNGKTYSVTSISHHAFYDCTYLLTSVFIPYTVTTIGRNAFQFSGSLISVTIPDNVTSIGDYAFDYCCNLTSIRIPKSVTSIGKQAFNRCSGLTTIISEIKNPFAIEENVFYSKDKDVYATATLRVPSGTKSLYQSTVGWNKFQNIVEADDSGKCGDNVYYTYNETTHTLTISGEGEMENWTGKSFSEEYYENRPWDLHFHYLRSIKSIIIESGVTSIGHYAFYGCSGLTSITIPNSVTSIGSDAFSGCSSLTSITIPNSVTSIGIYAFNNCSGLTSVTIPNNVTSIGEGAFYNCSGLTSIQVESGNQYYDSRNNCNAIINSNNQLIAGCKNTIIPSSVTSISYGAFSGCSSLTSITIPNSVTSIGSHAFSGCSSLTSITIPNSVTSIGSHAFYNCSGLTSIQVESGNQYYDSRNNCNAIINSNNQLIAGCKNTIIPSSVTSIGIYAFYNCSGLTSVTIPNNVTSIGEGAFRGCSGLVYITLPSKLASIGYSAFSGCNSLIDIFCKAENVPSCNYGYDIFNNINTGNIILHVPDKSMEAYKSTRPWNIFGSYYSLDNSVTQGGQKCSKPIISVVDGKIVFSCETLDVSYRWCISTPNGTNGTASYIAQPVTLNVFATRSGYQNSDVTTYVFPSLAGDVNQDGVVNVADHVKLSDIILGK